MSWGERNFRMSSKTCENGKRTVETYIGSRVAHDTMSSQGPLKKVEPKNVTHTNHGLLYHWQEGLVLITHMEDMGTLSVTSASFFA